MCTKWSKRRCAAAATAGVGSWRGAEGERVDARACPGTLRVCSQAPVKWDPFKRRRECSAVPEGLAGGSLGQMGVCTEAGRLRSG